MRMSEATSHGRLPWVLGALLGLGAPGLPARAEVDFSRATMGRTTYPAGSWVFDTTQLYTMPKGRDASADKFQSEAEVEHGLTERFSWSAGLETVNARRDGVQLGRGILGARYLALPAPLQLTPFAEYRPSLRRKADELEFGLEAMKNYEHFSLIFQGSGQSAKDPGAARRQTGSVTTGPLYRFGLNGIAGVQWLYVTDGTNYLASQIGGAVSKNIFLGLAPTFGLSRRAADFQIGAKIHVYFGDYRRQVFGLD